MTKTKRRFLIATDKTSILELTKEGYDTKTIIFKTGISKSAVNFYRRLYRVDNNTPPEIIDRIIHQILVDDESEGINYDKQQSCLHPHLFVKCPHCKLVLSEKDVAKIQAILDKYEPQIEKLRTEQTI